MLCTLIASAQMPTDNQNSSESSAQAHDFILPPVNLKSLPANLFRDQKNLFLAPFHLSQTQYEWSVPFALAGAVILGSDTAIEKHAPTTRSTVSRAGTASNAGVAALAGVGAGMFLWGHMKGSDQPRETGILAGEAAFDAVGDAEILKYAAGRERPFTGDDRGRFFQGGDSFPSLHASVSFAIASVIAHEYPGPATQILAYGAAAGVSAARFAGQKHFVGDLIVSSALGWYLGRQVYRSHSHYSDADIAKFGTFRKSEEIEGDAARNFGSPSVPLNSWVYPAMQRLISMGYIRSAELGMRPWTRMECARMLSEEAKPHIDDENEINPQAESIYAALETEFKDETARLDGGTNLGFNLDEVYTRLGGISGTPLRQSLEFGQTIVNDYGRPYGSGFNNVTGFTSHAVAGPLSFFLRAEYQHAASLPAFSAPTAQEIQTVDGLPSAPPATPVASVDQAALLEGYVGMQLDNWQINFGKQALWWGADQSGAMLFSTNAAPILMLQINRVQPYKIPLLGKLRVNYLVGRLSGYHWVYGANTGYVGSWTQSLRDQPFIVGEKISLKPTPDLELGFSITSLFGGPGVPATLHKLRQAGFSNGNGSPGSSSDPGDRRGGFDFDYRIPGARDWLSFYGDAFTDDEVNPWVAWNKTALTAGLYFARVPGIPKLDLRMEGVFTDVPADGPHTTLVSGFFYHNDRFLSGYTNQGNLIGSWIGREGQGADAWATYWLSARSKVQFNFRHQKVSHQFIPNGGTLTDFGVSADYWLRPNLGLSGWVQNERWLFPVIQSNISRNTTVTLEVLLAPHKLFQRPIAAAKQP